MEVGVGTPFRGVINVDIRDSHPDWSPFEAPRAPEGAPSVVYIVLDDVGFSALGCYGGPVQTPNIDRIAAAGVRYTQWHTTALCSPTRSCLLTGRNHTRNSMACITEAAIGFPNASGTVPPENGMLPEILGELGWNTYMVGKWHLCPTDEMHLASTRRNWPTGRGFERWYGFLGAETDIPGPGASGVLFAQGSHFGGHALYVMDDRLRYVYNFVGMLEQHVVATEDIPIGEDLILSASFAKDGEDPPGVSTGLLSLFYGEDKVGEGRIKTQPAAFGLSGTDLTVGRAASNVTDDFPGRRPWAFTGTVRTVAVDVSGEPYVDLERAAAAMIARE
jgi:Sulfatase